MAVISDANADMAMIKQMLNGGNPQGDSSEEAQKDAGLFERAMNAKTMTPPYSHPDAPEDHAMVKWHMGDRTNVVRIDPSVHEWDTVMQGEPWGSVPLERTLRHPEASIPVKPGPK